jgi:preprotein translocase subunit SecG
MVVLNIFHVLIAIAMVALVLVQRGAGATAGAAFGSGASGTVFGSRGAGTFLSKSTWVLAALFCSISMTMAVMISRIDTTPGADLGVVSSAPAQVEQDTDINVVPGQETVVGGEQQDSEQQVDLPSLQVIEEGIEEVTGGSAEQIQQAADDLPSLDSATLESTELNQESTAAGTDSDDS